ncbi:MAG: tetratricopeptide repeat protein [Treponema sp.]|nr:tetratricopeptide repeat protein [Treponema sp.]
MDDIEFKNENTAKRKSHIVRNILISVALIVVIATVISFSVFGIIKLNRNRITARTLARYWSETDFSKYEKIYNDGKLLLQNEPFNNTALIYYGYSCFYLAVSQTDSSEIQKYLDECISSLRLAIYSAREKTLPQIHYMLGKAYFYKNKIAENFYADLTIENLNKALVLGYEADDIYEYLGMSYAALGKTTESIAAFSEALLVRESGNLLVSIAEQYMKNGMTSSSKQYLYRVINSSDNDLLIEKSRIMLANIYLEEENYEDAQKEFEEVLKNNKNSDDAHYGIGVIYEKQGNLVLARSEWRNTLKIRANHQGALKKLSETKK